MAYPIERRPDARTLEFTAWSWPSAAMARESWPVDSGAVQCDAQQQPMLLHFAPGRWLAPGASAAVQARLERAAAAGSGVLTDASGKWSGFELAAPGASRLLAFTVDVAAVLAGRECAAVTLFDCPAIVTRSTHGLRLWVQASYAIHFVATAGQCSVALRRERQRPAAFAWTGPGLG